MKIISKKSQKIVTENLIKLIDMIGELNNSNFNQSDSEWMDCMNEYTQCSVNIAIRVGGIPMLRALKNSRMEKLKKMEEEQK